jgi:hypothetical protein
MKHCAIHSCLHDQCTLPIHYNAHSAIHSAILMTPYRVTNLKLVHCAIHVRIVPTVPMKNKNIRVKQEQTELAYI